MTRSAWLGSAIAVVGTLGVAAAIAVPTADPPSPIVHRLACVDGRDVAVGTIRHGDTWTDGVWRQSPAGWSSVPVLGGERPQLADVAQRGDGTVVAVGSAAEDGSLAVWSGAFDGPLLRVDGQGGRPGIVRSVVTSGGGFLAGGGRGPMPTSAPVIGTSADGRAWRWLDLPVPAGTVRAAVNDVATGPLGMVAVGYASGSDDTRPVAWHSSDGETWTAADVSWPSDAGRPSLADVAAGPDGFVATGYQLGGPAVWTSRDGTAWSRDGVALPHLVPGMRVVDVAALPGGGYVAVGEAVGHGDVERGLLWSSPDGVHWGANAVGPATAGSFLGVSLETDGVVVLGQRGGAGHERPLRIDLSATPS